MASSSIPDKIRKLDPTKLVTHTVVRRPTTKGKEIQGKERFPSSRAARRYREQEYARLKKALKHVTHGKNIFAYNHLRTNQVVYSLTRALDKNNVLSQLIYHGKKTVPPNLRKDMWIPYFSLHFPSSSIGLKAYRILRELSVQRQLSPNPETITITEDFINKCRPKDPEKAEEWDEDMKKRIGHIMDKKRRARVLMDQKATSVADVAATLKWQAEEQQREAASEDGEEEGEGGEGEDKEKNLSKKARKRLRKVRAKEEQKQQEINERLQSLIGQLGKNYQFALPETAPEYNVEEGETNILWADLADAQQADSWPEGVSHGVLKRTRDHIMQGARGRPIEVVEQVVEEGEGDQVEPVQAQEQVQQTEATETPSSEPEPQDGSGKWKKKLKFW